MAGVVVKWGKVGRLLDKTVVKRAVDKAAEEIADGARQWGEEHRVTGAYADGIRVESGRARDGRPVARAVASAPHSALVEYSSGQAPMRTAATRAGYRLASRRR